jgi:hypothetical protein
MKPKFEIGTNVFCYKENQNRIIEGEIISITKKESNGSFLYDIDSYSHYIPEREIFLTREECVENAVSTINETARARVEELLATKGNK